MVNRGTCLRVAQVCAAQSQPGLSVSGIRNGSAALAQPAPHAPPQPDRLPAEPDILLRILPKSASLLPRW